jgi:hypothetical protein
VAARAANMAALCGAVALLAWVLRSYRTSWLATGGVAAIFFALNAGSSSIQARPDFLETLLIMGVLAAGRPLVMDRMGALKGGLVLGALGLAAFLTKPYGLLPWGAAATYPFVAGRPFRLRRSLVIAGTSSLVICGGVAVFAGYNPYFILETVQFHFAHRDPSVWPLLVQTRDMALLACALVATAAAPLVLRRAGVRDALWPQDRDRRYWAWALALGCAAIGLGLGWHRGAYLTYYYHLILPALAVVAAQAAETLPLVLTGTALAANFALLMAIAPRFPRPDRDWNALAADIAGQPGPIVVDYMLDPLVRGRRDARVAGNGITRFAIDLPDLIGGTSPVVQSARTEVRDFLEHERTLIRTGPDPSAIYMDCVLFPGRPGDTRVPPRGFLAVPRNGHPLLLDGYDMSRYAPTRLFIIHPFYGSQNSPRQDAGTWILTIVKFSRTNGVAGPVGPPRLPLVLVPPND